MIITGTQVFVCAAPRNFVTIKLETDAGVFGLGDATLNGRELAVVAYLEEYLLPCLIGKNPFDTEDIWQFFYRGGYWRRGPVTMTAIGAIDMALWDIKGKALGTPVYNLIGGKTRQKILAYSHAHGKDIPDTLQKIQEQVALGYLAVRAQSAFPGYPQVYGISSGSAGYEPAHVGSTPKEERWNTMRYLDFAPKLFEAIRGELGDELLLLHDCHHRLTPIEAARLGKELEPYHLFWLEDAVTAEWQENFRWIRAHTTIPLAVGEVFNTIYDCMKLFTDQMVDYIRMTISHGGGITPMLKVAAIADAFQVKTGCHGASDMSPICLAAALHFDTAITNFGIQEHMGHQSLTEDVFPHGYYYKQGYFHLSEKPGLGVEYNEALAKKYPYKKAYLPVNRLDDGTLFNW